MKPVLMPWRALALWPAALLGTWLLLAGNPPQTADLPAHTSPVPGDSPYPPPQADPAAAPQEAAPTF